MVYDAEAELAETHSRTRSWALFGRHAFLGILGALLALGAPGPANAQARKIELGDLQKEDVNRAGWIDATYF
jgi:hypothetical protein